MDISHLAMVALGPMTAAPTTPVPSDLATERFNAMMQAASTAPATAPSAAVSVGASNWAAATGEASGTLGGQILDGLKSVSTDYAHRWQEVRVGINEMVHSPSASNMLKVQSELLQVSMQYELVGKAISRSTQNIDTLVRMS